MRNIEKIKQKKLNELIDGFVNSIPPLKIELQTMGKNQDYKDGKKQIKLMEYYAKESKDYELKIIGETIKKRIKKEINIDINQI